MRTNRKRVPVPFLWRAADGLGASGKLVARAYGAEVEGVFTRAAAGRVHGTAGVLTVPHSVPRLGEAFGEPALELGAAVTNVVTYSEDFSNAAWLTSGGIVTPNALVRHGISFALCNDNSAGAAVGVAYQVVTFTGNGTKAISLYAIAGTSPTSSIQVFDSTAGAIRCTADIAWSGGVPTVTIDTAGGSSGIAYASESLGNGVYRIAFTADNVVAANSNGVYCYPTDNNTAATQGTTYFGGVMAQNATIPGAYVKTTSAAAASTVDVCYFPFTLTPREMTLYVRGVELTHPAVAATADAGILSLTAAALTDPSCFLYRANATTGYRFQHDPGTGTSTTSVGTAAVYGDVVELRGVLGSTGTATIGASINGGTETTNGPSTAQALGTAWSATRLYLNGLGTGNVGRFAYTHVVVALGTKTLDEMRALAEVG